MSPSDRVTQLYPEALGSLFVAFYGSQGYGGGILTRPHRGKTLNKLRKIMDGLKLLYKCAYIWLQLRNIGLVYREFSFPSI
jgi:hypothetical protein